MQRYLDEIEAALKVAARGIPKAKAAERRRFMKAPMPMLGLAVPQQRSCLKRGYSFSGLTAGEQFPIWDHVWFRARTHEGKMQAGFFVDGLRATADPKALWALLGPWADAINCWDQSDTLSGIYATLLEARPNLVYPTLRAWNRDPDPWKRRQSVVSLLYYAPQRKRVLAAAKILPLIDALLPDPDHYVQKGVGWTLRECFVAHPGEALAFLERHAGDLAPAAFSAATEKLSAAQKQRVKALRKKRRVRSG